MEHAYLLEHSYEYVFEGEDFDEIKTIGIFSTREKAEKVKEQLKTFPGFKKYPLECFHLKYAKNGKVSESISNLYEICGQAQKSTQ